MAALEHANYNQVAAQASPTTINNLTVHQEAHSEMPINAFDTVVGRALANLGVAVQPTNTDGNLDLTTVLNALRINLKDLIQPKYIESAPVNKLLTTAIALGVAAGPAATVSGTPVKGLPFTQFQWTQVAGASGTTLATLTLPAAAIPSDTTGVTGLVVLTNAGALVGFGTMSLAGLVVTLSLSAGVAATLAALTSTVTCSALILATRAS